MKLIRHIDHIARLKGRDVLFLEFHPSGPDGWREEFPYRKDTNRCEIIAWLNENRIAWEECGPYANVMIVPPYRGQIYLDIPFDEGNSEYRRVRDYLEHPAGTVRREGVRFYAMSLDHAKENAAHDEPGFWENWAENF